MYQHYTSEIKLNVHKEDKDRCYHNCICTYMYIHWVIPHDPGHNVHSSLNRHNHDISTKVGHIVITYDHPISGK